MDTCKDLTEYLAAYADGELEGELRERVRVHLDACERCRDQCTDLKKVANLYRESPPGDVSTGDWEKVAAALDAAMLDETPRGVSEGPHIETLRARAEKRRASKWWGFPAAALAAAVLLVAVFHYLPLLGPPPMSPVAEVVSVETDPQFEAMVRLPVDQDDFLVIDVFRVE